MRVLAWWGGLVPRVGGGSETEGRESMKAWLAVARAVDALNARVGRLSAWLVLAMTLVSAANAVSRKAFNSSSNAFLEVQWVMFAAVFLLAAGYTLARNEHVRVDILNARAPGRVRLWMELAGILFFLLPFALIVLWHAWPFFVASFSIREVSMQAGGLVLWPAKLLIPTGFALLGLQGLAQAIKVIAALRGALPASAVLDRHEDRAAEMPDGLGGARGRDGP